ncbi:MAG: ribosome silencing factor, partial [Alphaproteobacteria bacterium]|nr:ribosome silencing factor [Alphaproteobacteria bacterium]
MLTLAQTSLDDDKAQETVTIDLLDKSDIAD